MKENIQLSKLCRLFDQSYHHKEAVLNGGVTWTYGEVYDVIKSESDRLKEIFSGSGRRSILVYLPSDLRFITYFFATVTSGHIPFTCSADLKKELVSILKHVSGIITTDEGLLHLKQFVDVDQHKIFIAGECAKVGRQEFIDPNMDAYQVFAQGHSSGSTGEPKVIDGILMKFMETVPSFEPLGIYQKGDLILSIAPLGHMYGMLLGLLVPFYLGHKIKTIPGGVNFVDVLKPEVLKEVQVLISTPPVYQFLAEMFGSSDATTISFPDTRVLVSATVKFDKKVIQTIRKKLKVQVFDIYGSTEAGGIAYRNTEKHELWQFNKGLEWRVNDENALELKLYLHPGKEKIWYNTGDLLELCTASGHAEFSLMGRTQEFLKIAGTKVFTFEIQNALKECDEVRDVVVLSHPTEEAAVALVQLVSGEALGLPKLKAFCQKNIGATRTPSMFIVLDKLPRDTLGKLRKNELRDVMMLEIDKLKS